MSKFIVVELFCSETFCKDKKGMCLCYKGDNYNGFGGQCEMYGYLEKGKDGVPIRSQACIKDAKEGRRV